MNKKNVFNAPIGGSSVKMLDNYIESKKRYLYITTSFLIIHEDKVFDIHFVISNKIPIDKKIVSTNITMTEFKKLYNEDYCNCKKTLNYQALTTETNRYNVPKLSVPVLDFLHLFYSHFENNYSSHKPGNLTLFDNPISLNAQSSNNRTGYGNEYFYDTLVYEGTKYGETDEFPIVGYVYFNYGDISGSILRRKQNETYYELYIPNKYL